MTNIRNLLAIVLPFLCVALLAQAPAQVQSPKEARIAWNTAHYTKVEAMVPMRDGKALYTVIYTPKDLGRTYPIIFTRTPYGASGKLFGSEKLPENLGFAGRDPLKEEGFIFVVQDVRGRYHSFDAGPFVDMRPIHSDQDPKAIDEATDTWDTVQWALDHISGNNGKVALFGQSYPGFYAACGLVNPHPAIKAAIVEAPVIDIAQGDDFRHHGAFHLVHGFTFLNDMMRSNTRNIAKSEGVDLGSSDAYRWFMKQGTIRAATSFAHMEETSCWNDLLAHPDYDSFWQERNLARHLKETKVPAIILGGWFDSEDLTGTLRAFNALNGAGKAPVHLIIGPWTHGGWVGEEFNSGVTDGDGRLGLIRFGENLAARFRNETLLPFLLEHLKQGKPIALPKAQMFETGSNLWRPLDSWPSMEPQPRMLYLQSQGTVSWSQPVGMEGADTFVSDPSHPVPHYPEALFEYGEDYPVANQWFASTRADVLVYESAPVDQDLTLAGSVRADLWVSTTGTDADWVVKIIDVWPDASNEQFERKPGRMEGYQELIRGDILRGKYRNSLERPEPFTPGKPTQVSIQMPDAFHTFKKGHRIMVQIQSSWFPLFDRNPQVFMSKIMEATANDFKKATHTVFHSKALPSRLVLPVRATEGGPK